MQRLAIFLAFCGTILAGTVRYARLGEFEGRVEIQLTAADDWIPAERNLPLIESTWVRTGPGSRVEIEFDEGSVWRLGPNSQGEIADYTRLSTGQRITLLALDRGLAYLTGHAEGRDSLILTVPGAQVGFSRAAKARVEVEETWSRISLLEGAARFSSPAAEMDLRQGQSTRVEPANPARFYLDREVVAMETDKWSEARDKAMAQAVSAGHVIERYGVLELDAAGGWIQTEDLGPVWKPKVDETWAPFRSGRWRWYDGLGYTWVSDEPWGWLPYHYGRWMRRENFGWIWAPARTAVFKPGEVFWLRGPKLVGWGPLAPGEEWKPGPPANDHPRQFLNVNTTFAAYQPGARVIDPAGFDSRPKEPLAVAALETAIPSPPFPASRLDSQRPLVLADRTRVDPVIDGVTFESNAPPVVVVNPPPASPPVIVVNPAPPPDPEPVAVPYPVPVYTGIIVQRRRPPARSTPAKPASTPNAPAQSKPRSEPGQTRANAASHVRKYRAGEQEVAGRAAGAINSRNFARALAELDTWSRRYPESDFLADRLYYYVVAYDGARESAKVIEAAKGLLSGGIAVAFDDPRQMILACYLTSVNVQQVARPTSPQMVVGTLAARELLKAAAEYFTDENRPAQTSAADWSRVRAELEDTARTTLAVLKTKSGLRD
jgi:hypothetical protein